MTEAPRIGTELEAGDLGRLVEQHGRLYRAEHALDRRFEAYVAAGVGAAALDDRTRFWIVREGDAFAGSAALCCPGDGIGQFRWFLLEPHLRGRGLGRELLDRALDAARDLGCAEVFLWTFDALAAAAALYRRAGFVATERRPGEPWGPPVVEVRYDLAGGRWQTASTLFPSGSRTKAP